MPFTARVGDIQIQIEHTDGKISTVLLLRVLNDLSLLQHMARRASTNVQATLQYYGEPRKRRKKII